VGRRARTDAATRTSIAADDVEKASSGGPQGDFYPTFRRLTEYFQYVFEEAMTEMYIPKGSQG